MFSDVSAACRTVAVSKTQSALAELWEEYVHSTAREGEGFTEEVMYELGLEG